MRVTELTFYVGTYTHRRSEGIYICSMDTASGAISVKSTIGGVVNPSYLAIAHSNRFLYCVNEISGNDVSISGSVSSFRIDGNAGGLTFLNRQPSQGSTPCHLTIDKNDRYVIVSNYGSGSLAVFPVKADGRLGPAVEVIQHEGSSIDPQRQRSSHPHSTTLDAANHFAFVPYLGLDRILIYSFDSKSGRLSPAGVPFVPMVAGAGPRHLAFDATGKRAYVTNELNSTLAAFECDAKTGGLKKTQVLSTLAANFGGQNTCADVQVHPSRAFVYASNRGHDSIAVFAVSKKTGMLDLVQHQSSSGRTPRAIVIDPRGRFLLVANQDSDSIVVFSIEPGTGLLAPTGQASEIPAPACLRFLFPA